MKKNLSYFYTRDIPRMEFTIGTTRFSIQHIRRNRIENVIEHEHPEHCYEIHMISKGKGRFIIDGRNETFESGSILFIGPGVVHRKVIADKSDAIDEWINMYTEKIGHDEKGEKDNTVALDDLILSTSFWRGHETPLERTLIDMTLRELIGENPGYRLIVESAVKALIVSVSRNFHSDREIHGEYTENALKYPVIMDDYFMLEYANLKLDDLAGKLNLSTRQTERLIREYYDMSFSEKKLKSRMIAARTLMEENPSEKISEIARMVGYANSNYFASAFRDYYGKSPTEYRERLLKREA